MKPSTRQYVREIAERVFVLFCMWGGMVLAACVMLDTLNWAMRICVAILLVCHSGGVLIRHLSKDGKRNR